MEGKEGREEEGRRRKGGGGEEKEVRGEGGRREGGERRGRVRRRRGVEGGERRGREKGWGKETIGGMICKVIIVFGMYCSLAVSWHLIYRPQHTQ